MLRKNVPIKIGKHAKMVCDESRPAGVYYKAYKKGGKQYAQKGKELRGTFSQKAHQQRYINVKLTSFAHWKTVEAGRSYALNLHDLLKYETEKIELYTLYLF